MAVIWIAFTLSRNCADSLDIVQSKMEVIAVFIIVRSLSTSPIHFLYKSLFLCAASSTHRAFNHLFVCGVRGVRTVHASTGWLSSSSLYRMAFHEMKTAAAHTHTRVLSILVWVWASTWRTGGSEWKERRKIKRRENNKQIIYLLEMHVCKWHCVSILDCIQFYNVHMRVYEKCKMNHHHK